jgi:hypothetical protein
MSDKKTIKVNPAYFSLNQSKHKTEKNKQKKKQKNNLKKMSQIIRPSKAKKELLKKIKEHQKQKKLQKKQEQNENILEFSENMKESMNYLQKVIHDNRQKKQMKKTHKNTNSSQNGEKITLQPLKNNLLQSQDIQIHLDEHEHLNEHEQLDSKPKYIQNHNLNLIQQKPSLKMSLGDNLNNYNGGNIEIKTWNASDKEEPKYGCLKNGKKPTYRQYVKTLKKPNKEILSIQELAKPKINFNERKQKLQNLIQKSETSNHNIIKKPNTIYKRYKIRKLYKTFKVGKYKDKKSIGVLLKDNKTRKKVKHEIDILHKAPISKVKSFLREKNLLKIGSKVPDNIAREIFINSILSGDVINKNFEVLVHNYMN